MTIRRNSPFKEKLFSALGGCLATMALLASLSLAALITKPNTFVAGTTITAASVNANFDTLYAEFNGGIDDANVKSAAAIQQSKISNLVNDLAARLKLDGTSQMTGALWLKLSSPYLRIEGTEASAKDVRLAESAGSWSFDENTGTEGTPTWTPRYTLASGGSVPAVTTDLTPKGYVDGLTKSLAFAKVLKTDGDFTTASATPVDVTGLTANITTGAHRVRITLAASIGNSSSSSTDYSVIPVVDGASVMGTGGLLVFTNFSGTTRGANASFSVVTDALTAAAHTIKIQVATNNGTMRVFGNATNPAVFSVEELPY